MVLSLACEERQAQAALCAPHEALLLAVQDEILRLARAPTSSSSCPPPVSPPLTLRAGPDRRLLPTAAPSSGHSVVGPNRISLSPSPWMVDPLGGSLEATLAHMDSTSVGMTKVALLQRLQHLVLHLCPTLGPGPQH